MTNNATSTGLRFTLAACILVAAQCGIGTIQHNFSAAPAVIPQRALTSFPLQLGSWQGTDVPVDERVFAKSQAAAMINRDYTNPLVGQIAMHLAFWREYGVRFRHAPNDCYTRAGWELVDEHESTIQQTDEQSFPVMISTFERQDQRIEVLYWYEIGGEVVTNREEVRSVLQRSRFHRAALPTMFKVMLQTSAFDDRAKDRLEAFALLVKNTSRATSERLTSL